MSSEVKYPTWERKGHRSISSAQVHLSTEVNGEGLGKQREMVGVYGDRLKRRIFAVENHHIERPEMKVQHGCAG